MRRAPALGHLCPAGRRFNGGFSLNSLGGGTEIVIWSDFTGFAVKAASGSAAGQWQESPLAARANQIRRWGPGAGIGKRSVCLVSC